MCDCALKDCDCEQELKIKIVCATCGKNITDKISYRLIGENKWQCDKCYFSKND